MAVSRHTPPQMQAAAESSVAAPTAERPRPQKPRSRMMRQYDLVERVRSYNPDTNEDLLNRAYVVSFCFLARLRPAAHSISRYCQGVEAARLV